MNSLAQVEFFSLDDVCSLAGLEPDTVLELEEARIILAMELSTGEKVFPSFQFGHNELRGELISLFQEFPPELNGWEITCWFYKENNFLNGLPLEYTYDGKAIAQLKLLVNSLHSIEGLV